MNIDQISQGLLAKFDKCRLVFWQDIENEFSDLLLKLNLETSTGKVEVIKVDDLSHLEVKHRIELLESETPFLLYSNQEPNEPIRDWLYDIRLYGESFYADASSMYLFEIGMKEEFRPVISKYKAFFSSKQRISRLKKIIPASATEKELELALIAATLNVETLSFTMILQQLLLELVNDFDSEQVLSELAKFNLLNAFWSFAYDEMGYTKECESQQSSEGSELNSQSQASLQDLVLKLLFTECYQALQNSGGKRSDEVMDRFSSHLLPMLTAEQKEMGLTVERIGSNSSKRAFSVSFINQLRESRSYGEAYNHIANVIEKRFEVKDKLSIIVEPQKLLNVETFEFAEKRLLVLLANQITQFDQEQINTIVAHRLTSHWCHVDDNYACIYKAIRAAKQFYSLKAKYIDGFVFGSASEMYRAYESDLFQFDAAYREFCENANRVAHQGSDILKATKLVDEIEDLYVNWYLHDLAIAWGKHVDKESLLDTWKLNGVLNQYDFYKNEVDNIFHTSQVKRVFVIISDALRYEVAHEIHAQINKEQRFKSTLKSQLGVVPSYTQIGMASLLPHQQLTAHINKKVEYKADGLSVHGHDNRHKILAKHQGMAVKASEVLGWTNAEGRQAVKDARIVYIYHDQIDAIGDKAVTENQTFNACADAIMQIKLLVERIINKLNGNRIVVTADHGFLFKSSDVVDSDKTALSVKPAGSVEAKKRYLIGQNLPEDDFYWKGDMAVTAKLATTGDKAEFMIPRGSNRFNFVGGAKFIHGGIMPQEICVPVLRVDHLKTQKQKTTAKQKVGVVPLGNGIRLVTLSEKIEFLQTDPINDKFKERKIELWVEDAQGNIVSNKSKVLFNSSSTNMEERKRSAIISLNGSGFERTTSYKLIMWDTEQGDKFDTHSVTIDLVIEDDFF